jgi:putative redox protein
MSTAITKNTYKTELVTRNHHFLADEPIEQGGQNLGPTPTELLHSSLASCTSITLRMYATRKKWEIEEIKVDVTDGINLESKESILIKKVTLIGNLDESQLKRMLVIAGKCPVHKILEKSIQIESSIS